MDVLTYVKQKANLSTLLLGVGSVLGGTGCAALRGNMEIIPATLCLIFVIFAQMCANFAHNYFGATKYYDNLERPRYAILNSEPVKNLLEVRVLREASFSCGLISAMLGLVILSMSVSPWWVLIAAALIVGLNYLLNFGKHPLFGYPVSLVFTWLLFGPIAVMGTSLLQSQMEAANLWNFFDHGPCIFLGPAMGFMACNVQLIYSYSTYKLDPNRKDARGVAFYWGPKTVVFLFGLNGFLMLALMFFKVFYLELPEQKVAMIPAIVAFVINSYITVRMCRVKIGELRHLGMMVKFNYFILGLLTLIIWWWIGNPDDSMRVLF